MSYKPRPSPLAPSLPSFYGKLSESKAERHQVEEGKGTPGTEAKEEKREEKGEKDGGETERENKA
jgi:hypothetical protein